MKRYDFMAGSHSAGMHDRANGKYILHSDHEAALAEAVAKAWEEAEKVAEDCPCHWDGEQIAKAIRRARGAE